MKNAHLLLLLCWLISFRLQACETPLLIGTLEYPPYMSLNDDAASSLTNIVPKALAEQDCTAILVALPFARGLDDVKHGRIDGLLSVWHRPERAEFLHYGPKLFSADILVVGKTTLHPVNWVRADLSRKRRNAALGIVRGYALPDSLQKHDLRRIYTRDDLTSFHLLLKNRVQYIAINKLQLAFFLSRNVKLQRKDLTIFDNLTVQEGFYFALGKHRADYELVFNKLSSGLQKLNWDPVSYELCPPAIKHTSFTCELPQADSRDDNNLVVDAAKNGFIPANTKMSGLMRSNRF